MKKILIFALVLLVALTSCAKKTETSPSDSAKAESKPAKVYTVKLGHTMSTSHPRHLALLEFEKYVEENSNGQIQVELFPGAVLGSEPEMQESMRMGTLEAFVGGPFDTISKKLNLFLMPFFFDNQDDLMRVAKNEQVFNIISEDAEKGGLKVLAIGDGGSRQITNSKRRIDDPSDMKGLKLRTPSIEAIMVTMKELGANTVSIPLADCYMSLKTGVADGQENPIATIYDQKLHEVQKYITYVNYQYHPEVLTMNASFYNSLPADLQKVLSDGAWFFIETENKLALDNEKVRIEEMKAAGCDVYVPTAAEKQAFVNACEPVYAHFVNTLKYFSQEELDLVKSIAQSN